MTSFTRTWDAAYEAIPAESEDARLGATRIRNLKTDIQERLEVDHSHAGDANDGAHKKVTMLEQAANPATVANTGYTYSKDVGGVTELFYMDSAGTVTQLTSAGVINPAFLQKQTGIAYTTAGTATAFTLTPAPALAALVENAEFDVEFNAAAGATPTLAVSGLTAKALKYRDITGAKQAITSTQVPSGWRSKVTYDGTDWVVREVVNSAASETVPGIAELATAAEVTALTDAGRVVTPLGLVGLPGRFIGLTTITATNAAWAPNAKTTKIVVCVVGGGGAGGSGGTGGADSYAGGGGGGGGGGGARLYGTSASVSGTYAATVGAAASTSSFIGSGISISAPGGKAGTNGSSSTGGKGGNGGVPGNNGSTDTAAAGGEGSNGAAGGAAGISAVGAAGTAGTANTGGGGGGGGGGDTAGFAGGAGGAGGSGVIYVWEFS